MKRKQTFLIFTFLLVSFTAFAYCESGYKTEQESSNGYSVLLIPAFLAALGFVVKTIYEAIVEQRKRDRTVLEDKLKHFYWPILTRLEENEAIWKLILTKRSKENDVEKSIGDYAETNIVLKNHREIIDIITKYRYLAKFDDTLSNVLKEYFRHVVIYEGILKARVVKFPTELGAPYPKNFDGIIRKRTEALQKKLDSKDDKFKL